MPYFVDIDAPVSAYLPAEFGPQMQEDIERSIAATLEDCSDSFREEGRTSPGSACFQFTHFFPDEGRVLALRFVVDDSAAAMGVLQVAFADYEAYRRP